MGDIVFKNAMFGFDKEDVVRYIEQLQENHIQNDKLLEERTVALEEATSQVAQLQEKINKLQTNERMSVSMTQENTQKILDLECENRLLREKAERYEKDCEKLRIIESQVGAVILDARVYSEKIIEEANDAILQLNKQAAEIITKTATDISLSSDELSASSENLSELLSDVNERISGLSADLSGVASNLDSSVAENVNFEEAVIDENVAESFNEWESVANDNDEICEAEESESVNENTPDNEADISNEESEAEEDVTLEVTGFSESQNFKVDNNTLFEE